MFNEETINLNNNEISEEKANLDHIVSELNELLLQNGFQIPNTMPRKINAKFATFNKLEKFENKIIQGIKNKISDVQLYTVHLFSSEEEKEHLKSQQLQTEFDFAITTLEKEKIILRQNVEEFKKIDVEENAYEVDMDAVKEMSANLSKQFVNILKKTEQAALLKEKIMYIDTPKASYRPIKVNALTNPIKWLKNVTLYHELQKAITADLERQSYGGDVEVNADELLERYHNNIVETFTKEKPKGKEADEMSDNIDLNTEINQNTIGYNIDQLISKSDRPTNGTDLALDPSFYDNFDAAFKMKHAEQANFNPSETVVEVPTNISGEFPELAALLEEVRTIENQNKKFEGVALQREEVLRRTEALKLDKEAEAAATQKDYERKMAEAKALLISQKELLLRKQEETKDVISSLQGGISKMSGGIISAVQLISAKKAQIQKIEGNIIAEISANEQAKTR